MSAPSSSEARTAVPRGREGSAPPWASGMVVGIETAVLSAGLVFAFVFAAVAAAPSADGSIAADWSGAWDVGTSIWLLAHGVPQTVGAVTVSLVPVGLTLVIGLIAASVASRVAVPARSSVVFAASTHGLIAALVAAGDPDGSSGLRAGIVGGAVVGVGASLGLGRVHGFRFFEGLRLPPVVGTGVRLGSGLAALGLAAGVVQASVWMVVGADRIAATANGLSPDLAGGIALAAGETGYVPTLSVWALAWLSGSGFTVGVGSVYAPGEIVPGPVPDLPLLAALPAEHAPAFLGPAVLAFLGGAAFVLARTWLPRGRRRYASLLVAVPVLGVLVAVAAFVASGSAGGGVLEEVGPDPVATGLRTALWCGLGLLGASAIGEGVVTARSAQSTRRESPTPPAAPEPPPRIPENTDPLRLW